MTEEQFREMLLFARNNSNKTSRVIEFRGKQENTNEWCYGFYTPMLFAKDFEIKPCITDLSAEHMTFHPVIPETIGQFTGLTDKNGKKIFEGDIVRQDYSKTINVMYDPDTLGLIDSERIEGHHIGIVKISPHKGVGMRNPMSYNDVDCTKRKVKYYVNVCCYRCEVIGNIHDNPELLKGWE